MTEYSPKATVPVLVLSDGTVIDESLDVMLWALEQNDPARWLLPRIGNLEQMLGLIDNNDNEFKGHLDRYKYPDRYDNVDPIFHRQQAECFIADLNARISAHGNLFGPELTLADFSIVPFVLQFANTNRTWFDATDYTALRHWLDNLVALPIFQAMMAKYPQWHDGDPSTWVP